MDDEHNTLHWSDWLTGAEEREQPCAKTGVGPSIVKGDGGDAEADGGISHSCDLSGSEASHLGRQRIVEARLGCDVKWVTTNNLAELCPAMDGVAAVVQGTELSSTARAAHGNPVRATRLGDARDSGASLGGESGRPVAQRAIDEERTSGGVVEAVGVTRTESKAETVENGARHIGREGKSAVAEDCLHHVGNGGRLEVHVSLTDALSEVLTSGGGKLVSVTTPRGTNDHLFGPVKLEGRV